MYVLIPHPKEICIGKLSSRASVFLPSKDVSLSKSYGIAQFSSVVFCFIILVTLIETLLSYWENVAMQFTHPLLYMLVNILSNDVRSSSTIYPKCIGILAEVYIKNLLKIFISKERFPFSA